MTSSTSSGKRGAWSVATLVPTAGRPRSTAARSSRRKLRPPSGGPFASIEVVQLTRKRRNQESVMGWSLGPGGIPGVPPGGALEQSREADSPGGRPLREAGRLLAGDAYHRRRPDVLVNVQSGPSSHRLPSRHTHPDSDGILHSLAKLRIAGQLRRHSDGGGKQRTLAGRL
jgi:hypothetical protein